MPLSNTEKSTWNTLYKLFAVPIFTYLLRQVKERQDAEDLLLEVFLSAFKEATLGNLSEERQLAWLRRVARNKVVDYHRHQGLINWLPLVQADKLVDEHLTPEEQVEQEEKYRQIFQALKQLSPVQQELVRLRYGYELRFTEIADMLERPVGTVRKMLTRTLRQLRTAYDQLERGKKL